MKRFLLLVCLLLASPANAYPRLTGEQWNKLAALPSGAHDNLDLSTEKYTDVQMANAYIDGVHDMLQGRSVCVGIANPDEVNSDVFHAMRALPPAKLKESAAELIAEILRQKYPCTAGRKK